MNRNKLLLLSLILALFVAAEATAKSNVGNSLPKLKLDYVKEPVQAQGKPMLLAFWATWSSPSVKNIPSLNELYSKYKDKGLVVLGVTDEEAPQVTKFLKDNSIDFSLGIDKKGALTRKFKVEGVPFTMLFDKDGKVVWEGDFLDLDETQVVALLE